MKKILLIGTGGTIASDVTEDGLAPELTSEQLLNHLPAISSICDVECIQLLNLDSTNMRPEHWLDMVRCIRENYDRYDGFVITHGTDTMAYYSRRSQLSDPRQSKTCDSHRCTEAYRI